jgi:vanillate O-demethylase monooxygenase subunit
MQLSLGWLEGCNLVCPYHGWTYAPDGACVRIPSITSQQGIPKRARATVYQAEERYGLVWVCLDEPKFPIPDYPYWGDPGFDSRYASQWIWKAAAGRVIENFVDISHFPFVHSTTLGNRSYPVTQEHTITQNEDGFTIDVNVTRPTVPDQTYHLTARIYMPFTVLYFRDPPAGRGQSRVRVNGRTLRVIFFTCSPLSMTETKLFELTSQNYALDTANDEADEYSGYSVQVFEEDRRIVEAQRPEELPFDLTEELHIKGPDISGIEYRRWMARLVGDTLPSPAPPVRERRGAAV